MAREVSFLKSMYVDMVSNEVWHGDKHMTDYVRKNCDEVIELEDGDLVEIEKPRIETRFCFGYGLYGVSTDEDMREAEKMRRYAQESEDYFLKENLKGIEGMLKDLRDKDVYFYKYVRFTGCNDDSKIKGISRCTFCHTPENEPWRYSNMRSLKELTETERQNIINGYENVKARFEKRLRTYLRRYGTKKLTTWTYLVD